MGSMKNGTTESALIRLFTAMDMAFINRIGSALTANVRNEVNRMRLIDADALKAEIATIMPSRIEVFLVVDKMPDAIVRCKDCDNKECWGRAGDVICGIDGTPHRPDWYCADGEART